MADFLRAPRSAWRERPYRRRGRTRLRCSAFELEAPESHILGRLQVTQPFRDLGLGVAAQCICDKYRDALVVWQGDFPRPVTNHDILCLHEEDEDVFEAVSAISRTSSEPPRPRG